MLLNVELLDRYALLADQHAPSLRGGNDVLWRWLLTDPETGFDSPWLDTDVLVFDTPDTATQQAISWMRVAPGQLLGARWVLAVALTFHSQVRGRTTLLVGPQLPRLVVATSTGMSAVGPLDDRLLLHDAHEHKQLTQLAMAVTALLRRLYANRN